MNQLLMTDQVVKSSYLLLLFFMLTIVRLEGRDFFEAFVMEARALGGGPSNMLPQAGVGRFVSAPRTSMFLSCRDKASSAVVNAPNPVRMNNLTFMWEAPYQDVGDIYFMYGSLNHEQGDNSINYSKCSYLFIERACCLETGTGSLRLSGCSATRFVREHATCRRRLSNSLCCKTAGELVGCGIRRTCVRLCGYYQGNPICTLDEAEYVLIIEIDPSFREAQITLGGYIRTPQVNASDDTSMPIGCR